MRPLLYGPASLQLLDLLPAWLPSAPSAAHDTGGPPTATEGRYFLSSHFVFAVLLDSGTLSLTVLPSHSCPFHLSERLRLCPRTLTPSPALSFVGWLGPFPLTCFVSAVGSCCLSCSGHVWGLPVPAARAPPASLPLPRR